MDQISRDVFFQQLLVDYVLLNEILVGQYNEQCLQKVGIKQGMRLEDQFRAAQNMSGSLSVSQFTELVISVLNNLGGEYVLKAADEERICLTGFSCPFGHLILKSPRICQIISGIIGGIASRNFEYSKVDMAYTISRKHSVCQLVVHLKETHLSAEAEGTVYLNQPTSYLLTRSEINSISGEMPSNNAVYNKYLKNFESLQLLHKEMETEYNQLRNEIFSNLKLGVITVNEAGKITYMNQTAQELLNMDNSGDAAVQFHNVIRETLLNGMRFNQHLIQLRLPRGVRYFSINTAPLYNEDQSVVNGAVSVFQDVTEKRILENEMNQMEKFALVAELAAGTAHEIRNPMTTLRGFLQILAKEFKPETKGYEYCSLMIEEIDRANSIIREFLLLTKPTAPRLKEADLHVILEEIFLLIESKSLLENVEIRRKYAKSLPLVKADPAQIKQVFLNLATNAIQAMPAGGHLMISTTTENGNAVVRFTDSGCGIDEAQLAKIFNPFFTTKENGTGLGLTISYRIIENHGGRLYAQSVSGKGSTFTVELPAIGEEETES